ncbi:MAG: SGNH/GDSL hydrolase family protein [Acidimicrobiia bacterium]
MRLVARGVGAAAAVIAGQAAWAIWRPLPTFADLDPNGLEGPLDGQPLKLVALGDSSCTGSGLANPADIWLRVLARRLGDHGYRVEVTSFATGGSKAADVARDQLPRALEAGGDVALVSVGGNDALRGVRLGAFERALDRTVTELRQVIPVVALSGVGDMGTVPRFPPMLAAAARRRGKAMNAIHHRVGERHDVLVADQWEWAVERFRDRSVFAPDLFHPNAEGHRVWAEVAYELLAPGLPGRAET